MGKFCGGDERGILDAHAVVQFVALAQATENRDGILDARLLHHYRLETALERGIFLDVLAVFVERRGADAVQFTAREHRLEHVAGVHGALGFARSDHRMDFVNEEDDLALGAHDFVEHGFEAFLEFAAKLRPRDERPEIEADKAFVLEAVGHVAGNDAAGQSLDDGGLADAGLANKHGIVLRAARQHLNASTDFGVAADDRVELILLRQLREVAPVFFEGLVSGLWIRAGDPLVAAHFRERLKKFVAADVERLENLADAGVAGSSNMASAKCSTLTYSSLSLFASSWALTRSLFNR